MLNAILLRITRVQWCETQSCKFCKTPENVQDDGWLVRTTQAFFSFLFFSTGGCEVAHLNNANTLSLISI